MPRTAMADDPSTLNVAMINGKYHNALTLSEGFMDLTNDATTMGRKRSELNTFLGQASIFLKSVRHTKVPCILLLNWFARYLDEQPLAKQSAINKITTVVHALLFNDLVEPDPIFPIRFETMRKSAITLARNTKAAKAPVILSTDPFTMLPAYTLRLAVIWLMTGVRYISLPEMDTNYEIDKTLPFEAASGISWRKTELPSKPLLICVCHNPRLKTACPIHTSTTERSLQLAARAATILKYLQANRHTPRRTLAIGFKLWSKHIDDPVMAEVFRAHINVVFGWTAKRGRHERGMFLYYTEDAHDYLPEQLPDLVGQVVEFYDATIPIVAATPINILQFKLYKNWLARLAYIGVLLSDVQDAGQASRSTRVVFH